LLPKGKIQTLRDVKVTLKGVGEGYTRKDGKGKKTNGCSKKKFQERDKDYQ